MGWNSSLLIIENSNNILDDRAILKAISRGDFQFDRKLNLQECIYPDDGSINIGHYKGNIIICDDFQITIDSLERARTFKLTKEENGLVQLFSNSEIVTVACRNLVNYHGYSLIKNGKKIRLKTISAKVPIMEFGPRTREENKIYESSHQKEGKNFWKDESDPEQEYTEDQLMEDFTFGFAQRRLGVLIDHPEGDEVMENVTFKKYIKRTSKISKFQDKCLKSSRWLLYVLIVLILIFWLILKTTLF